MTARTPPWAVGITLGVVAGLAWAGALRAYMAELVGLSSRVDWVGTFVGILLPGAVLGGLLAGAELLRRGDGSRRGRWLALAPLVLAIIPLLVPGSLWTLVTTGTGAGGPAIAAFALLGGLALSGRGPLAARIACGVLTAAVVVGVVIATPAVGGPLLALDRPRGVYAATLGASLLVVLAAAASIPHRIPAGGRRGAGSP